MMWRLWRWRGSNILWHYSTKVSAIKSMTTGGGCPKLRDVIYRWPLRLFFFDSDSTVLLHISTFTPKSYLEWAIKMLFFHFLLRYRLVFVFLKHSQKLSSSLRSEAVSYAFGMILANRISASKYLETSAITGEGVNKIYKVFEKPVTSNSLTSKKTWTLKTGTSNLGPRHTSNFDTQCYDKKILRIFDNF